MQVEQKVPVTRVARVSEMRTVGSIADDALILVVQNGSGSKTTFGQLKRQILAEAKDAAESYAVEAATLATNRSAAIASDLATLSGNVFKKEVPELQRNMIAADQRISQLSTAVKNAAKFDSDTRKMLIDYDIQSMKNKDSSLESMVNNAMSTIESARKQLAQQIADLNERSRTDLQQHEEHSKEQLKKVASEAKADDEQQKSMIQSAEKTIQELGLNISGVDTRLKQNVTNVKNVKSQLEKQMIEVTSLKEDHKILQDQISALSAAIEDNDQLNQLKATIGNIDTTLFGVKVKHVAPTGVETVDVVKQGEIDIIHLKLQHLEENFAKLSSLIASN